MRCNKNCIHCLYLRLLSAGCPGTLLPSCLCATIKLFDLTLDGLPKFHIRTLPICFPLCVSGQMTAQSLKSAAYKHTHARLYRHPVQNYELTCHLTADVPLQLLLKLTGNILYYFYFRLSPQRIRIKEDIFSGCQARLNYFI